MNYERNDYDYTSEIPMPQREKPKNNSGLIAAVSILSSVLVIGIVIVSLFVSGVFSLGDKSQDSAYAPDTSAFNSQAGNLNQESSPTSAGAIETVKPVPVNKYMYVGNCKQSVTLRTGANQNASEIRQVPLADQIYVLEYTNSSFAKVIHNGTEGYIKRDYIVDVRPEIWTYNANDAETQVANSLRAFVSGINTGSTDYVYTYFAGSAVTEEINSHNSIVAVVESEEILSLNCHSVERISASEVTVIRDSVIRVVYKDGSTKDIKEKYRYTLDLSNGMRITKLQNIM